MRTIYRVLILVVSLNLPATGRAQVAGQPYQIPAGFESYPAGSLITYGGYNYVTQPDGTMLLAAQQPQTLQQYTIPYTTTTPYVYTTPYVPVYTPPYVGGWYGGGWRGGPWVGPRPPGPWVGPRPGPWMGGGPGFMPPGRMPGPFIRMR